MKKLLIITALILCNACSSHAMQVSLPDAGKLNKFLCNKGYRIYVENTKIVNNLAGKTLSLDDIDEIVKSANKVLLRKQTNVDMEMLQNHKPKIIAIIVQQSHEALSILKTRGLFTPETLKDLKTRGIPVEC